MMILQRIDDEKQRCLEAISHQKSHTSINDTTLPNAELDLISGINDVEQKLRDVKAENDMEEQRIYQM
jgi:hypothetical protein